MPPIIPQPDVRCTPVAGLSLNAPTERLNDAWIANLRATAAVIPAAIGAR